ncbi:hypothetical protein NFI96_013721 [Prochilodus magdalenae]|nr:hypothetical protein NFI96_013721 [Prochilodus magdalenae]
MLLSYRQMHTITSSLHLSPLHMIMNGRGRDVTLILKVSRINTVVTRKREQRVLFLVVTMVVCYLLCWLPYGIMALVATFGQPGLVTPEASIVPSLLAKTSTVINPVIYIFMNKQVSAVTRDVIIRVSPVSQRPSTWRSKFLQS